MIAFLKSLVPASWACLLVACASFALAIYAWLPLANHSSAMMFPLVWSTMLTGFSCYVLMARHRMVAAGTIRKIQFKLSMPRFYSFAMFSSLGYLLLIFFGSFLIYPQGVDLGTAVNLRIASAFTLFLNIAAIRFAQWSGLSLRAYRALK